jgi:hypothetical protein
LGAGALLIVGLGGFLDGLFRLDCEGIDIGCENGSWHSEAHRMEGRFTTAAVFAAPIILAFAFRRLPRWRDTWIPTLAAIPASLAVGIAFSGVGDGAAVRATTLTWFVWLAYAAFQLLLPRAMSTAVIVFLTKSARGLSENLAQRAASRAELTSPTAIPHVSSRSAVFLAGS